MSNHIKQKKEQTESIAESLYGFFQYLLSGILWVYIFLLVVAMPFYFTQGYVSIGTDKANFLRQWSLRLGRLLLPVLVIYCVLRVVIYFQKNGLAAFMGMNAGRLWKVFREHFSVTDIFAVIFGCSLLLSYSCSDYKEQALWGAGGWYMGLVPQLIMLLAYFLISRAWLKSRCFFLLLFSASAVVFALGYLNRFGIYPIEMEAQSRSFISTIGNINWYCGYLVSVFFAGIGLLWLGKEVKVGWRVLAVLYALIGFASLVTQGSVSGIFALVVVLVVMFCLSGTDGKRMQNFWQIAVIFSAACMLTYFIRRLFPDRLNFMDRFVNLLTDNAFLFLVTFVSVIMLAVVYCLNRRNCYSEKIGGYIGRVFAGVVLAAAVIFVGLIIWNTLYPGKIAFLSEKEIFTFSDKWGSYRGATWKAGIMCFLEQNSLHKLVGAGPDCMSAFLYEDGSEQLVALARENFGAATLTNAHNEWITVLVNMGLTGAVGYVGMMMSAIVRYIKAGKRNWIVGACGLCLLAYTVNNMFSFQQTMNFSTIFIMLGVGEAYLRGIEGKA